jgi:hypothetical protein
MTKNIWKFELKDEIIYMPPFDSEIPIPTWDICGVTMSTYDFSNNSALESCARTSFHCVITSSILLRFRIWA